MQVELETRDDLGRPVVEVGHDSLHQLMVQNGNRLARYVQASNEAIRGDTTAAEEGRALFPAVVYIVGRKVTLHAFYIRGPILRISVKLADLPMHSHLP